MDEFRFVETTKLIQYRKSPFIVKADSYEDAILKIINGINNNLPARELPNEGDIEIMDVQFDEDYEIVSEKIESRCNINDEMIYYEKRKDI
jgi:hypothetical protein